MVGSKTIVGGDGEGFGGNMDSFAGVCCFGLMGSRGVWWDPGEGAAVLILAQIRVGIVYSTSSTKSSDAGKPSLKVSVLFSVHVYCLYINVTCLYNMCIVSVSLHQHPCVTMSQQQSLMMLVGSVSGWQDL